MGCKPAAAWIGGGTLYGKGNLAATAGFSNNIMLKIFRKTFKYL